MQSNVEWELLARADPLYAIASDRGHRRDEHGWDHDAFFAKGRSYLEYLDPVLDGIPADATILDLGCGAGRLSRALADRYRQVIGIDAAPSMVELAEEMCADVTNIEFRVSNGVELPAETGCVDAVVTIQVLQHVDPVALPRILAECRRVTRPGGQVVLHIPAPWVQSTLRRALTLVRVRRLVTKAALRLWPKLNLARRGWVVQQYHTYRSARIRPMLIEAGLVSPTSFEFRPGKPHSTVWVATAP